MLIANDTQSSEGYSMENAIARMSFGGEMRQRRKSKVSQIQTFPT